MHKIIYDNYKTNNRKHKHTISQTKQQDIYRYKTHTLCISSTGVQNVERLTSKKAEQNTPNTLKLRTVQ